MRSMWLLVSVRVIFGLLGFLAALGLWIEYLRLLGTWLDPWAAVAVAVVLPFGVIGVPFFLEDTLDVVIYLFIAGVAIGCRWISRWARDRMRWDGAA